MDDLSQSLWSYVNFVQFVHLADCRVDASYDLAHILTMHIGKIDTGCTGIRIMCIGVNYIVKME